MSTTNGHRADPLAISGIPTDVPERVAAIARTRLASAFLDIARSTATPAPVITIGHTTARPPSTPAGDDEEGTDDRARRYEPEQPRFTFEQLIMPPAVAEALLTAVEAIKVRSRVYDDWGLRRIEPSPSNALNLHGPPGTGKTLAAHAIAARLGMPILMAGYAELESKFHGDGPKNVKAAFHAAEQHDALLFIDEADSLLSRRLTDVTQGSEQAINSMRSQIVLCLDRFSGIVVFSTNLVANYDRAFESRVRHFRFELPDAATRLSIWRTLLVPTLPLDSDVDVDGLNADTEGFSGREVKLAILTAAERAAVAGRDRITHADLTTGITQLRSAKKDLETAGGRPATPQEAAAIESQLRSQGVLDPAPSAG